MPKLTKIKARPKIGWFKINDRISVINSITNIKSPTKIIYHPAFLYFLNKFDNSKNNY